MAIAVAAGRHEQLSRLVEGALGWPVVAPDDNVLPPRAMIVDVVSRDATVPGGVPTVLLVADDDEPTAAAAAALGARRVLRWPPSVAELVAAVDTAGPSHGGRAWCTMAGATGGLGTTAVALGLAGLRAWRHGRTLVALSGAPHVEGVPTVAGGDLASPAAWAAGAPVAGLDDLRAVGLAPGPDRAAVGDVPTVVDLGAVGAAWLADRAPDVLVVRPDRSGLAAAEQVVARCVVVVGRGPVDASALRTAADGAPVVGVRHDARVARACHRARHPTDAPGRWLRPLDAVVDLLDEVAAGTSAPPRSPTVVGRRVVDPPVRGPAVGGRSVDDQS